MGIVNWVFFSAVAAAATASSAAVIAGILNLAEPNPPWKGEVGVGRRRHDWTTMGKETAVVEERGREVVAEKGMSFEIIKEKRRKLGFQKEKSRLKEREAVAVVGLSSG